MVQRHDLSARHSGVLQRRQSSTTPNNSAGDCSSSTPTAQRPTLPTQRRLYTTDSEVFVISNAATFDGEMSHQLPALPSCSHLLSTPNGPVTYAEKHGTLGISAGKGASDMRFLTFANTSQTIMLAHSALCVFPKHASSEGPVPHPGLLRVLGLAVWASAKRSAGIRRRRHFPGRRGRAGDHVRSVGGVELGIRHRLAPNFS
jgi:hypothetical protein